LKLRDRELRLTHAKADATATPSKRLYSPAARLSHGKPGATPSKRPYSPAAQAHRTPAKKFSGDSRSPSSINNRSNSKATASYQGLRASKTDVHKKSHGVEKPKERTKKRPTVAARKAKANMQKEGGTPKGATPKQAGFKRKFDSRTPDSSRRVNKAQKKR
jgi:nucleolar protein 12